MLIVGLTFKENCPDLRNTRVVNAVVELRVYGVQEDVHDPCVDPKEAKHEYGLDLVITPEHAAYGAVILAVGRDSYKQAEAAALREHGHADSVFCDLKSVFSRDESDLRL